MIFQLPSYTNRALFHQVDRKCFTKQIEKVSIFLKTEIQSNYLMKHFSIMHETKILNILNMNDLAMKKHSTAIQSSRFFFFFFGKEYTIDFICYLFGPRWLQMRSPCKFTPKQTFGPIQLRKPGRTLCGPHIFRSKQLLGRNSKATYVLPILLDHSPRNCQRAGL